MSLENAMGSFSNKKIYMELEATNQWFNGHAYKLKSELQTLGVNIGYDVAISK